MIDIQKYRSLPENTGRLFYLQYLSYIHAMDKIKIKKQQPVRDQSTRMKVRLDSKTVITVHSMEAFNTWKARYPQAQII